ncbi:MAG: histidine--tRNA ligase [Candidatus Pacebacteria bacterium]|nr:histidine--tRNA ligase [Candidatus Paceibacterota bacterium]
MTTTTTTTDQPLQTLKGFRDIFPEEKRQRDYVQAKIIETYQSFGFQPLETPTLEYASLLLGKYGQEADQLVYTFKDRGGRAVGLRYDQTVPTARILAQYRNNLPKFFRRYQVQNVFRADKPQSGRYREFTQCDIDIFGTNSPLADAEVVACVWSAYKNVGFKQVKIELNDRQTLLSTLDEFTTQETDVFSIIQTIDKLDKKSEKEIEAELVKKGLTPNQAKQVLAAIKQAQPSSNLKEIINLIEQLGVSKDDLIFNPALARGLDYYTGLIFEVSIPGYDVGSVGGGGRYDSLIQELGGVNIPAVGYGLGFDRTVEAAIALDLIPDQTQAAQVLVTLFDPTLVNQSLKLATKLRQAGLSAQTYPEPEDNLGKQLKLANQKNIPWVVIQGPEESEQDQVAVKNMKSGKQETIAVEQLVEYLNTIKT